MSNTTGDEVIIPGRLPWRTRCYRWLLDHLASFPGRVTSVTFAAGAIVTVAVITIDGDDSATTVVSLVATLWALFFAVMIYLLTARDTDRVLDQIADLREQLATALAEPDEAENEAHTRNGAGQQSGEGEVAVPSTESPAAASTPSSATVGRQPSRPSQGPHGRPRSLEGTASIAGGVPAELLDAWTEATGRHQDELRRAWTRDPRSDRQWVLESAAGQRWVVFSRDGTSVGVLSLDHGDRGHGGRQRRR